MPKGKSLKWLEGCVERDGVGFYGPDPPDVALLRCPTANSQAPPLLPLSLEWLDEQAVAALISPGFEPNNPAIATKWTAWLEANTAKGSPDISNPLRRRRRWASCWR
jgi:hypothetical protein